MTRAVVGRPGAHRPRRDVAQEAVDDAVVVVGGGQVSACRTEPGPVGGVGSQCPGERVGQRCGVGRAGGVAGLIGDEFGQAASGGGDDGAFHRDQQR